jgi:hypothetical protein
MLKNVNAKNRQVAVAHIQTYPLPQGKRIKISAKVEHVS